MNDIVERLRQPEAFLNTDRLDAADEIVRLRQFHHDQQELHETNEALHLTNRILRGALTDRKQEIESLKSLRLDLQMATQQLAAVTKERNELVADAARWKYWRSLFDINIERDDVAAQRIEVAFTPEALDAAVDAALAKVGKGGE